MLQTVNEICGKKLHASDGEIGHIQDLYFDDQSWVVRYVVVIAGSWLSGRQVLISPHAFESLTPEGDFMKVKLTRKQIETSPAMDSHKPVSRQYEEQYYQHYGLPYYWQGNGLWGETAIPTWELPENAFPSGPAGPVNPPVSLADVHLRSTNAVRGYNLQARDGKLGHVSDFLMDDASWGIRKLIVQIGDWFPGKKLGILTGAVDRISYEESTVFLSLTMKDVEHSPVHH